MSEFSCGRSCQKRDRIASRGGHITVRGKIKNGVVVLQNGAVLPEGTTVSVMSVRKTADKPNGQSTSRRKLLRHAGKAVGLPKDAARILDRYLYSDKER
jgi:hypothetical protein